jgi:hypothetical protein
LPELLHELRSRIRQKIKKGSIGYRRGIFPKGPVLPGPGAKSVIW